MNGCIWDLKPEDRHCEYCAVWLCHDRTLAGETASSLNGYESNNNKNIESNGKDNNDN